MINSKTMKSIKQLSLFTATLLMVVSLASLATAQQTLLPTHNGICDNLCGADPLCEGQPIGGSCGANAVCDSSCGCVPTFFCSDADESRACCELIGNGDWLWGTSGEDTAFGGFSSKGTEGGIGDDPGEFLRFRQCSGSSCQTDVTDTAACKSAVSCVFEGECYGDIDEIIETDANFFIERINTHSKEFEDDFEELFENFEERKRAKNNPHEFLNDNRHKKIRKAAVWNSNFRNKVYKDVGGEDIREEVCDPGFWGPADGIVTGIVVNITDPVEGVTITILGSPLSDVTDAAGAYEIINVPAGTYSLTASKPQDGYLDDIAPNVDVPGFGSVTQSFTLPKPSLGCNNDCTRSDGLCHANCQGRALCNYETPQTQSACNLAAPGLIDDPLNPGQQITCCTGTTFTPTPANVKVCGDDVINKRIPVLYKGIQLNVVIVNFDAESCQQNI